MPAPCMTNGGSPDWPKGAVLQNAGQRQYGHAALRPLGCSAVGDDELTEAKVTAASEAGQLPLRPGTTAPLVPAAPTAPTGSDLPFNDSAGQATVLGQRST